MSAKRAEDGGASARCLLLRSFFSMILLTSDAAPDGCDHFHDSKVSGNATLEALKKASTFEFLGYLKCAAAVSSRLEQSWIRLLHKTSCDDKGGFWAKVSSTWLVIPAREAYWELFKRGVARAGKGVSLFLRDEFFFRYLVLSGQAHSTVCSIFMVYRVFRFAIKIEK